MENSIRDVQQLGQSIWYDNIRLGLISSGELKNILDLGVTGLTSNPTIFQKAVSESNDYDELFKELVKKNKMAQEIYEILTLEDIQLAADLLKPSFDQSHGADGYASLEVNPHLANNTDGTIKEAKRLFSLLDRPNVMVKVPATPAGIPAIRALIGKGINVNVTLTFSLDIYSDVRKAYIDGLEDLKKDGGNIKSVSSVASFFISRVDTLIDDALEDNHPDLMGKAAIANAKLAYRDFNNDFTSDKFLRLSQHGARVQRPLWASTSTKNPQYSDVLYPESLIGRDTVNTMPESTLLAFNEHGKVSESLGSNIDDATQLFVELQEAGIYMKDVTSELLAQGLKLFVDSYDSLISDIEHKRKLLELRI